MSEKRKAKPRSRLLSFLSGSKAEQRSKSPLQQAQSASDHDHAPSASDNDLGVAIEHVERHQGDDVTPQNSPTGSATLTIPRTPRVVPGDDIQPLRASVPDVLVHQPSTEGIKVPRPGPLKFERDEEAPTGVVVSQQWRAEKPLSRGALDAQASSNLNIVRKDAALFLGGIKLAGRGKTRLQPTRMDRQFSDEPTRVREEIYMRVQRVKNITRVTSVTATRLLLTTAHGVPFCAFSMIPYRIASKKKDRRGTRYADETLAISVERKGLRSYAEALERETPPYDPTELDDPDLKFGKHVKVLALPSYRVSVNLYTRPSDLKKELNQCFREKFPDVRLTLSKLRSLKRDMVDIAYTQANFDLSSVALAFVYYERLVLKCCVGKDNRKIYAAVCLLFALKMNGMKDSQVQRSRMFRAAEEKWKVSQETVLANELAVLSALDLDLKPSPEDVLPHIQRIELMLPEQEP